MRPARRPAARRVPPLLVLLLAGCTGARGPAASPAGPPEAPAAAPEDGADAGSGSGLTAVRTSEGFTVRLPGEPLVQRGKVPSPQGEVTTGVWAWSAGGRPPVYSVSTVDYPPAFVAGRPAEALLEDGIRGLTHQLQGTLRDQQPAALEGHPGRAFRVASPSGEVRGRSYLVGTRLYTLVVLFDPAAGAPLADAFLDSLQLHPPAAPARR